MAHRFFYSSLGLLCLVLAYQLGGHRVLAQGEQVPNVIRARAIEVVDGQGTVLVSIGGNAMGGEVIVKNPSGRGLVALVSETSGGGIAVSKTDGDGYVAMVADAVYLFDDDGDTVASFEVSGVGSGIVSVSNDKGERLAQVTGGQGGSGGSVEVYRPGGDKPLAGLRALDDTAVLMMQKHGLPTVAITSGSSGGAIGLMDPDGDRLVTLDASPAGRGGRVLVHDSGGGALIGLAAGEDGEGHAAVFDRAGDVRDIWP
jgi:hypothetical protein